jgi:hypothetical protein
LLIGDENLVAGAGQHARRRGSRGSRADDQHVRAGRR